MPGRLRRIKALKTATDIHIGASPAHVSLYGLRGNNAAGWIFGYRRCFRGVGFCPFVGLDGLRAAGGGEKRFSLFSGAKRE